jgi:hypothetical protein
MTLSRRGATALFGALGISVFLNLVAAGFFGVVIGGTVVGDFFLRQRLGPIPVELRQSFRSELFAQRGQVRAALVQLRHDRDTLHDALTAETLDQPAIDAANATVRQDADALLTLGQDILVKAVAKLPPEVRKKIPQINLGNQLLQSLTAPDQTTGG